MYGCLDRMGHDLDSAVPFPLICIARRKSPVNAEIREYHDRYELDAQCLSYTLHSFRVPSQTIARTLYIHSTTIAHIQMHAHIYKIGVWISHCLQPNVLCVVFFFSLHNCDRSKNLNALVIELLLVLCLVLLSCFFFRCVFLHDFCLKCAHTNSVYPVHVNASIFFFVLTEKEMKSKRLFLSL